MGRNRARWRVHKRADLVAHLGRQHPPSFFPGSHPARGPDIGIAFHGVIDALRHRAQRIADEIGGAFQDGELGAIAEKIISHARYCTAGACSEPWYTPGTGTRRARVRQLCSAAMHPKPR